MRQPLLAATLVLALAACTGDDAAPDGSSPDAANADTAGAPTGGASEAVDGAAGASGAGKGKDASVYSHTFTHKRQSFLVEVGSSVTRSTVTVTPKGLGLSNKPVSKQIDGLFSRAEMADLDADGEPEIYVFLKSADGRERASAFVVASDQGRRVVEVPLPDLAGDAKNGAGYQGADEFAIVGKVLARRFPLHDAKGEPTGTMRQLQYTLGKGASGPALVLDQAAEF